MEVLTAAAPVVVNEMVITSPAATLKLCVRSLLTVAVVWVSTRVTAVSAPALRRVIVVAGVLTFATEPVITYSVEIVPARGHTQPT